MDKTSAGPPPQRTSAPGDRSLPTDLSASDYVRPAPPRVDGVVPPIRGEAGDFTAGHGAAGRPSPDSPGRFGPGRWRPAGSRVSAWCASSPTRWWMAFVVSVALMIVAVVAVAALWMVLAVFGVFNGINSSVSSLLSDDAASFDIKHYLGFPWAGRSSCPASTSSQAGLATIGAHLYNLAAALLGGVEATFRDD